MVSALITPYSSVVSAPPGRLADECEKVVGCVNKIVRIAKAIRAAYKKGDAS